MKRDEAIEWLKEMKDTIELYNALSNSYTFDKFPQAIDMAISALEKPNYETDTEVRLVVTDRHKDKVVLFDAFGEEEYLPKCVLEQIRWERDTALETLEDHGIGFGQRADLMSHEEAWSATNRENVQKCVNKSHEKCDLISRAKAIEWLERCAKSDCDDCKYDAMPIEWCSEKMLECVEAIKAEPVSAEPFVRCWACKWFFREYTTDADTGMCDVHGQVMRESDYCSWAERRE